METAFIMYYDIKTSNDIIKEGQITLDLSPEFCFKRLIYRYLLESGHAPDDLACGPCSVPESKLEHIKMLSAS